MVSHVHEVLEEAEILCIPLYNIQAGVAYQSLLPKFCFDY
jgi:hypothetical protein